MLEVVVQDDGGRGDLTDEQWKKIQPLLPPQKAWTGQPAADHRRILNGILWLHRIAHRGEIFQSAMVNTAQSQVGFTDGDRHGCGNGCGRI